MDLFKFIGECSKSLGNLNISDNSEFKLANIIE